MSNKKHELAIDSLYYSLIKLMDQMPYKSISITDIVNDAGFSRMAFYRNYKDKDDILIRKLNNRADVYKVDKDNKEIIFENQYWERFLEEFHEHNVVKYSLKAGLERKVFEILKEKLVHLYRDVFDWDLSDQNNVSKVYEGAGAMFGLLTYYFLHKEDTIKIIIVNELVEIAKRAFKR